MRSFSSRLVDHALRLRDHDAPALFFRMRDVERDDAVLRRAVVGRHVDRVADVSDRRVRGVPGIKQRFHRRGDVRMQRIADVEEIEAVVRIGAVYDADVHEPSGVTHRPKDKPLRLVLVHSQPSLDCGFELVVVGFWSRLRSVFFPASSRKARIEESFRPSSN
jgi:hypothetical protein